MAGEESGRVVVLTQVGRFPKPEDFESDRAGALERLRLEALRVQAEAVTCLSQLLGHLVGDCEFDRERFDSLLRRAGELTELVSIAEPPVAPDAAASAVPSRVLDESSSDR